METHMRVRDILIHDYIGVDIEGVWNVAVLRIPELEDVLENFRTSTWRDT